jgi:hypothetical protein
LTPLIVCLVARFREDTMEEDEIEIEVIKTAPEVVEMPTL